MDGSSSSSSNLEAGVSGSNSIHRPSNHRRGSYRAMPVAAKFFVEVSTDEKPQPFLDGCALCRQPLRPNRDIFMYRGDMPFCSEECRQERIEMDEAMEKRSKPSTSLDSQKKKSSATSPPKSQSIHVPAGTVVAG